MNDLELSKWTYTKDKYPEGSGSQDDPTVIISDGKFIGTAEFWGDCWECVNWLNTQASYPYNNKSYDKSWGYMEEDDIVITKWMYFPEP